MSTGCGFPSLHRGAKDFLSIGRLACSHNFFAPTGWREAKTIRGLEVFEPTCDEYCSGFPRCVFPSGLRCAAALAMVAAQSGT
jgi:hypothetical protein